MLRNAGPVGDGDMFRSSYYSITKVYGLTLLTFTRRWGCEISRKKCYVTLEWPHVHFNCLLFDHIRWHSSIRNIAFISLLIDKIDQSVVPIYHHQLVNSCLHSRNSFIATSQPLLYTCASSQKLVSRSGRHPTATS